MRGDDRGVHLEGQKALAGFTLISTIIEHLNYPRKKTSPAESIQSSYTQKIVHRKLSSLKSRATELRHVVPDFVD
jgi:hypothetical protein